MREIALRMDINKYLEADYNFVEDFYLCFNSENNNGLLNLIQALKYKESIKPFKKKSMK
ncbi:hypothetical protein ES705_27867 [subsurface metagenome]